MKNIGTYIYVFHYNRMRSNKIMYGSLLNILSNKYARHSIVQEDMDFIRKYITKENTLLMLGDIINNDSLLKTIANRSYVNALGFKKIILMDLSQDLYLSEQKAQLQLHICDCEKSENSVPMFGSIHKHSFDFVSYIISGYLENQQFVSTPLSDSQQLLLKKLQGVISSMTKEQLLFFNEQLEIIEAIGLSTLGSEQLFSMKMADDYNLKKLENVTGLTMKQLFEVKCIEGYSGSAGESFLKDYVCLNPYNVLPLETNSYYFHPYHLPHRLYYDNTVLNSCVLITTPVKSNTKAGVLKRPTCVQNNEDYYEQIAFNEVSLKETLITYLNYLSQC